MADGVLADIARDLVRSLRRDVTIDWVSRDDVRAKLRSTIKRLLARYGYPPDAEPVATSWSCGRWRRSLRSGLRMSNGNSARQVGHSSLNRCQRTRMARMLILCGA